MNLKRMLVSFRLSGLQLKRNSRLRFGAASTECAIEQHVDDAFEAEHPASDSDFAASNLVDLAEQLPLDQFQLSALADVLVEPIVQVPKLPLEFLCESAVFVPDKIELVGRLVVALVDDLFKRTIGIEAGSESFEHGMTDISVH